MIKCTQRELRELVSTEKAIDVTNATTETRKEIEEKEGYYRQIGYSAGIYGCNGMLLQGKKTGTLYAVCSRSNAIWIF